MLREVSGWISQSKRLRTVCCRGLNRDSVMKQGPRCPAGASGTWTTLFDRLEIMGMSF